MQGKRIEGRLRSLVGMQGPRDLVAQTRKSNDVTFQGLSGYRVRDTFLTCGHFMYSKLLVIPEDNEVLIAGACPAAIRTHTPYMSEFNTILCRACHHVPIPACTSITILMASD